MQKYTFTCSCGDVLSVEGNDEVDAKNKFMELMTEDAAKAHFAQKHGGQTMPPYDVLMASVTLVPAA